MTTITKSVNDILESTIGSVKAVLPFNITVEKAAEFTSSSTQHSIGVLIGMTGDVLGRLIFNGEEDMFSKIGEGMFGMRLEGDMLESFAGELGNMMAGHLSTSLSQLGYEMDITPPTVLVGQTRIVGADKALHLTLNIENAGSLTLILMSEL